MKIRTQIYILLAGIILIPSLAFGALLVVNQHRWNQFKAAAAAERTRVVERMGEKWREGPPPVMFPEGEREREMPKGGNGPNSSFHRVPPPPRIPWLPIFAAGLGLLFAFCAVVMAAMARSIGVAVTHLGEATGRIAAGDLDTSVHVKGSNEISSLSRDLDAMRSSLKEAKNRQSRFIMGVSHDLRTPLALIKGYTEALGDGTIESAEQREQAQGIINAKIDQLQELIDDLIDVVRLESNEWRQHLKTKPLLPLLTAFQKHLVADGALLKRTVTGDIDVGAAVAVPLDERMFTRMLENLTGNAFRYTAEGGTVDFSAKVTSAGTAAGGLSVIVTISDNGCGIADADMPFIFDTFYRGSNSRREEGKGFGLAIVKSVADSYGWAIKVASKPGSGAVFTIEIPVTSSR